MLAGSLTGCGIQAIAFLLTGNVLAPIVAHIVLHWQLTMRGNEMPPASGTGPGHMEDRHLPASRTGASKLAA